MIVDITLEKLRSLPTYAALTPKQKRAVEVFLSTGSTLDAALTACECTTFKYARKRRFELFKSPRVLATLAEAGLVGRVHHQTLRMGARREKTAREIFDERLNQAINDPRMTKAQVRKLRAEAGANGYFQTTPKQELAEVTL